ncbi:MAG: hypothetical protein K6G56_08670 [Clostridiales bacterium]|nr:hypothetical protein [Clostridiales bacterium]
MVEKWYEESKVKTCGNLDDLFELWITAHREEGNSYDGYKTEKVCKRSFTVDGFLSDKDRFNGILLIAKESNLSQTYENGYICGDGKTFWLRQAISSAEPVIVNGSGTRFINGLAVICNGVTYRDDPNFSIERDCLKNSAYMNLNKRGGFSSSKIKSINAYVCYYKQFIAKEIELINPSIIVCCGSGVEEMVRKALEGTSLANMTIISADHPSCRKSYCERLGNLKKQLK